MSIDTLKAAIPDFAKDVRLNLSSMASDDSLSPVEKYGLMVACGIASRNAAVRQAMIDEAKPHIDETTMNAAKAAAAIMGMNNIYYRFTHLSGNKEFANMPAKLRMSVIGKPGVDKTVFELWSLAVSAINGCGKCINAHEDVLRHANVSNETIQTAVRYAAIIQSAAIALEAEAEVAA
ncbi:carboxymuconolactone decarboxylase family protein [Acuticoccus mangrovi]|uniref:Alkyl hydroperoxide reductase AhpD n=1 Tax=Acuticoccus mangrovi TaxID=2796142 RepID=A0A934IK87_9HYPH|nr:carboxymuconolactone decarboxylase family protein [Acuticoccus mangrovi]MBJ3774185.1 carboxymuconolactone decarboxylase family protein [Acuticoccus mangrovi]